MERGNFFETVSAASYFLMVGFWVLLVATILLGTIQATLSEILKDIRKLQTPTPPAPAPQPAPPGERTWEDVQQMIKQQFQEWYRATKAEELLRWREAAASRPAMRTPPVKSDTLTPATGQKPATTASKQNAVKPITPPKPTP